MKKTFLIPVIVAIIMLALIIFALVSNKNGSKNSFIDITDFDKCISRGFAIVESYPRKCQTPDGRIFTEDIGNELEKMNLIRIETPRPNQVVKSPLIIRGQARGLWFFEASFPVKLFDANNNLIATAVAQTKEDWMTENFVSFEAELNFSISEKQKGLLVLEKDNPSGLPTHADQLRVPVVLEKTGRKVMLYYYNPELDKDESGNVLCSRKGLVGVERLIPVTKTPIQDTIKLLLQGALSEDERKQGITTEYPLEGFSLKGASLRDGILTLEFEDLKNRSGGGSCRVGILWFQIEATAKQFPEVKSVRFLPEELFQP